MGACVFCETLGLTLGAEDYFQRTFQLRASALSLAPLLWGLESSGFGSEWSSEWITRKESLGGCGRVTVGESGVLQRERSVYCCSAFCLRNLSHSAYPFSELKGNENLGHINRDGVSRRRGVGENPTPSARVIRPYLEHCVEFRTAHSQRDTYMMEGVQRRVESPFWGIWLGKQGFLTWWQLSTGFGRVLHTWIHMWSQRSLYWNPRALG